MSLLIQYMFFLFKYIREIQWLTDTEHLCAAARSSGLEPQLPEKTGANDQLFSVKRNRRVVTQQSVLRYLSVSTGNNKLLAALRIP